MFIGYTRESAKTDNIEFQKEALLEFGCEMVYHDVACGARDTRPELDAAMFYLRPDDTLVVWKLDRIGGNLRQLIKIVQRLNDHNVNLIAIADAIDTREKEGKGIFKIFKILYEYENNLARERASHARSKSEATGRVGGRKRKVNSTDIVKIKKLHEDPEINVDQICEMYGITKPTLYRYLKTDN